MTLLNVPINRTLLLKGLRQICQLPIHKISADSRTRETVLESPKRHKVYIFESTNVFKNLAAEHWLYENGSTEENILLLWRNNPCVVIGRHQNPWVECNLDFAKSNNIEIARRQSGGGAVYHDLGNLNCTFLTSRKSYDKMANLQFLVETLKSKWNLDVSISNRDDILLNGDCKISGSASKLGPKVAYHHCTLLFGADINNLTNVLSLKKSDIKSNATASVSSKVKLLSDVEPSITFEELTSVISQQYIAQNSLSKEDIHHVTPNDKGFQGLKNIEDNLRSWNWIFAKTPKFLIEWSFPAILKDSTEAKFNVNFNLDKGRVTYFEHELLNAFDGKKISESPLRPFLIGMELSEKGFNDCLNKDILKPNTSQTDRELYRELVQKLMLKIKNELIN